MSVVYRRSPLRVLWGPNTIDLLPQELRRLGVDRVLVLCGPSVKKHPTLVPRLSELLGASLIGVSSDVRAHSPLDKIETIAAVLSATAADSIVAVGGGSAFVTARAAAVLHAEGGPLERLATRYLPDGTVESPKLLKPKVPIIAVPTTPTTATGKAGTAVTVEGRDDRLAMLDPRTRAQSILLDPDYLASSPLTLLRNASLNAIVMAIEGLSSPRSHVFSDAALAQAVRQLAVVLSSLPVDSPALRMDAALASLLVGDGTDAAGGGLTAALSHTIGHQYAAHNGAVDAVLLPHVLRLVPSGDSANEAISDSLRCTPAEVADTLRILFSAAGAPARLRDLGVQYEDLGALAAAATKDFAYGRGAHRPEPDTITAILSASW